MKNILHYLLCSIFCHLLYGSVEHKDDFIENYLSNISENMDEKTHLLSYVKDKKTGVFLEIGAGGDAIAIMAAQLDPKDDITLIAADIDCAVLEAIPNRRPEIRAFLHQDEGLKVKMKEMSAVDFQGIEEDSLSGIGASALTHEVFSYASSLSSIDQFIKQVSRSLSKDGIFIYRDPKWVDHPDEPCVMKCRRKLAKFYATLFLSKFFDRDFSLIRDYKGNCSKPSIHMKEEVYFHVFDKKLNCNRKISFDEFFKLPTSRFDFDRSFSIEARRGLLAEIERHYCMYIKDFFCPGFLPEDCFQEAICISKLSQKERELLHDYCNIKGVAWNGVLHTSCFPVLLKEYYLLEFLFENGLALNQEQTGYFLKQYNNHPLLQFKSFNEPNIDVKLMALMFHGKNQGIYEQMRDQAELPWGLLEHLQMEGEEHYFYKTQEELLIYFSQISRYFLKRTSKEGYMLAPIHASSIQQAARDMYKKILERDFLVMDFHGNISEPVTEKNIFHLKLQREDSAKEVYQSLIKEYPGRYQQLEAWIEDGFR